MGLCSDQSHHQCHVKEVMLSLAEEVCGATCATRDAGAEITVLKDPRNPNDGLAADGQVEVGVGIMKAGAPLYSFYALVPLTSGSPVRGRHEVTFGFLANPFEPQRPSEIGQGKSQKWQERR